MPASKEVLSRLSRTMQSVFRIGNISIKDETGKVAARNSNDTRYVDISASEISIHGDNATHSISLSAPSNLSGSITFKLPAVDGTSDQFLKTDGSGNLAFSSPSSYIDRNRLFAIDFDQATSSPLSLLTLPANSTLISIAVNVSVAASGGSPTVDIGTALDTDAFLKSDEVDLKDAGKYVVNSYHKVGGTPVALMLTLAASAQTFGGQIYIEYNVSP